MENQQEGHTSSNDSYSPEQGGTSTNHSEKSGQRHVVNPDVLASVFQDLPSLHMYDPSWYNNRLRGEFGQIGTQQNSGPLLPRSYHLMSEDLEEFLETDDESGIHSIVCSRSGGIFGNVGSKVKNKVNLHVEIKHDDEFSPSVCTSRERDGKSSELAMSPVTNEFKNEMKLNDDDDNQDGGGDGVREKGKHWGEEKCNKWASSSEREKGSMAQKKPEESVESEEKFPNSNKIASPSIKKAVFRFGRKSVASTVHVGGDGSSSSGKVRPRKDSKIMSPLGIVRRSLFSGGQNDRDGGRDTSTTPRESILRRSTGAAKTRGKTFGRKAIVYEWNYSVTESVGMVPRFLEEHFQAQVMSEKPSEVRIQLPSKPESRNSSYSIVLSTEKNGNGSRIILRRTFGDSLRGGSDQFEWLCSQIVDQLRKLYPAVKVTLPPC